MITALGGGILRDVLLGALPPATFSDWRYLAVATAGGLVAQKVDGGIDKRTLKHLFAKSGKVQDWIVEVSAGGRSEQRPITLAANNEGLMAGLKSITSL